MVAKENHLPFSFLQIQELETENSELKQQLQNLEEQLMIAHTPPVSANLTGRLNREGVFMTFKSYIDIRCHKAEPAAGRYFLMSLYKFGQLNLPKRSELGIIAVTHLASLIRKLIH